MKGAATRRPCRKTPFHRPTTLSPMHLDKRRRRVSLMRKNDRTTCALCKSLRLLVMSTAPGRDSTRSSCNERRRQGHLYFDALCETKSLLPHFISFRPSVSKFTRLYWGFESKIKHIFWMITVLHTGFPELQAIFLHHNSIQKTRNRANAQLPYYTIRCTPLLRVSPTCEVLIPKLYRMIFWQPLEFQIVENAWIQ